MSDLPIPDHLHTMQISMLESLQKYIFHIMKTHAWLAKNNGIWLPVPDYDDLKIQTNTYEAVSHRNGKEM
jgi:hypothetical protein